jgi:hypothetical protein
MNQLIRNFVETKIQFEIIYNPLACQKWQAVDSSGKVWKSHIYKKGILDWIRANHAGIKIN